MLPRVVSVHLRVLAGLVVTFAGLAAAAWSAQASVTCPTVSTSGTVTPAPAPDVNWSGCWLQSANLAGANLSGANLSGAELLLANLSGANLTNANLSASTLNASDMAGADLTGATLTGAHSYKITGTPSALPQDWHLVGGYLEGPGAYLVGSALAGLDLAGFNLTGADLSQSYLAGTNLSGADLEGADLNRSAMTAANLGGADLDGANLSNGQLASADISGADLTGASLGGVESGGLTDSPTATLPPGWVLLGGYLMGRSVNLTGADLTGLNLAQVDLEDADLASANLSGTQLAQANLAGVESGKVTGTPVSLPANWLLVAGYLIGPQADLQSAILTDEDLAGADLAGADLYNADLSAADLAGTDLDDANLTSAFLTGADLSGANVTEAEFGDATLTSAGLNGTDLATADLTGVISGSVTGMPELPANWLLRDGYLIGPSANLQQASLAGVNLAGADLQGTDFGGTNLSGADLSGANLTSAWLGGVNLANATVSDAVLAYTDMENANLTDASLAHATLTSPDLTSVTMSGTNFTGASLEDVLYYAAGTGTPAELPAHWAAVDGFLMGPTVEIFDQNLRGANLRGDDLAGAVVYDTDLSSANLDDVNLTGAEIEEDTLTGASMVGVIWLNTICPDGSNSNKYVRGCFSPLDTTPPVVSVTGVSNGRSYVLGAVPAPRCRTTDNGTVSKPAVLTLTARGSNGVGTFTATCSGAVDLAGNRQQAAVRATYTVGYGMHGFLAPANGATIARSSRVITVRFRLTNASGTPVASARAAALAAAHRIRVSLQGPGIGAVTVLCGWNYAHGYFTCASPIPARVRTGTGSQYTITVSENVTGTFVRVPAVRGASDPEVIHFR